MQELKDLSIIKTSAQNIWNQWLDEEWFQIKVEQTFKVSNTPGKETALLIEREMIKALEKIYPSMIGKEKKNNKEVLTSMGDFWLKSNDSIQPVNIKVKASETANRNLVSLNKILKMLATGSINNYWVLIIDIPNKNVAKAEIVIFDLLQNINICHYDAGIGNLMLKKYGVNKIKANKNSELINKNEIISELNLLAKDGYERLIKNRTADIETISQIEKGYVPSLNNVEIAFKDGTDTPSTEVIVSEANKRTQKISLWEDISHEKEIIDFIQQNPSLDEETFVQHGKQDWLEDIERTGGFFYWKNQVLMGDSKDDNKTGKYWTDERIKSALTAYMKVDPSPSLEEIRSRGPKGLANAIHKNKGLVEWKSIVQEDLPELQGLDLNAKVGRKGIWTDARIRMFLQKIIDEHNEINISLLEEYKGLSKAVSRAKGIKHWRVEMGLVSKEDADVSKPGRSLAFTDKHVEQELIQIFEEGYDISMKTLKKLNKTSLLAFIQNREGIIEWREKLNLDLNEWDEERALHVIIELSEKYGDFKLETIRKYGPIGLEKVIRDSGGTKAWKKRLNVSKEWTDEKLEQELIEFQKDHPMLVQSDFFVADRLDLYYAMGNNGGVNFWREKMGIDISPRWSSEVVQIELSEFMNLSPELRLEDFRDRDRMDLYYAMADHGSVKYWREKMGLKVHSWTPETIEKELKEFIKICPELDKEDFRMHGKLSLYNAMGNNGGVNFWKEKIFSEVDNTDMTDIEELVVKDSKDFDKKDIESHVENLDYGISRERLNYWTYKRVESALLEFFKDFQSWDKDVFIREGKLELFLAMKKRGGIKFWKKRLALLADKKTEALPEKTDLRREWTEENIKSMLSEFIKISPQLERKDFVEHDKMSLYNAMRKHDGVYEWRKRMGVENVDVMEEEVVSSRMYWTKERIESELREFMKICPDLKQQDFFDHDKSALFYAVVDKKKGMTLGDWQRVVGVQSKKFWTKEMIIDELQELHNICPNPTEPDFKEHDKMDLYAAIMNRGGLYEWKEKIGLKGIRSSWTEEELEEELRKFQKISPKLSKKDFKIQDKMYLYYAMNNKHNTKYWLKHLEDKEN